LATDVRTLRARARMAFRRSASCGAMATGMNSLSAGVMHIAARPAELVPIAEAHGRGLEAS
jgi:hypothetical protein